MNQIDQNLRNLKDFLLLYNKVTELCFTRCVDTLSERDLGAEENGCVNNCVNKFARFNQKMMSVYVEVQTELNKKREEEVLETQRQLQRAQEGTKFVAQEEQAKLGVPVQRATF